MGSIKLPTFVVYKNKNNIIMKLKYLILALWTINAGLVLIGATALILDQLNII